MHAILQKSTTLHLKGHGLERYLTDSIPMNVAYITCTLTHVCTHTVSLSRQCGEKHGRNRTGQHPSHWKKNRFIVRSHSWCVKRKFVVEKSNRSTVTTFTMKQHQKENKGTCITNHFIVGIDIIVVDVTVGVSIVGIVMSQTQADKFRRSVVVQRKLWQWRRQLLVILMKANIHNSS